MDAEADVDVRDVLVVDTKLQEGRILVFDALAEIEVEFLDARKVADMGRRMCRVMVDGKGVAVTLPLTVDPVRWMVLPSLVGALPPVTLPVTVEPLPT